MHYEKKCARAQFSNTVLTVGNYASFYVYFLNETQAEDRLWLPNVSCIWITCELVKNKHFGLPPTPPGIYSLKRAPGAAFLRLVGNKYSFQCYLSKNPISSYPPQKRYYSDAFICLFSKFKKKWVHLLGYCHTYSQSGVISLNT